MVDSIWYPLSDPPCYPAYSSLKSDNYHSRHYCVYSSRGWGKSGPGNSGTIGMADGQHTMMPTDEFPCGWIVRDRQTQGTIQPNFKAFDAGSKVTFYEGHIYPSMVPENPHPSPLWPEGVFNRIRGFVKISPHVQHMLPPNKGSGPYIAPTDEGALRGDINFGTYTTLPPDNSGELAWEAPGNGNGHGYHHFCMLPTEDLGVWQQFIIDRQPQTLRNWNAGSKGNIPFQKHPYPTLYEGQYAHWGYMDCLHYTYWSMGESFLVNEGHPYFEVLFTPHQFFQEDTSYYTDELERRCASLSGTYIARRDEIQMSFSTLCGVDSSHPDGIIESGELEIRRSFSTTYTPGGWDNATFVKRRETTGSVYREHALTIPSFDWEGNNVVYIAFKYTRHDGLDSSGWGHREIAVTKDNSMPPLPGGVMT